MVDSGRYYNRITVKIVDTFLEELYLKGKIPDQCIADFCQGRCASILEYLPPSWSKLNAIERQGVITNFNMLVIREASINALLMQHMMQMLFDKVNSAKTIEEIAGLPKTFPKRLTVTFNNTQFNRDTSVARNIIYDLVSSTILCGHTAKEILLYILELMLVVGAELDKNSTFFAKPFYIAGMPMGVSIYALNTFAKKSAGVTESDRRKYYDHILSVLTEIVHDAAVVGNGFQSRLISAPRNVLNAVFSTRFFKAILEREYIDGRVVIVCEENPLAKEITLSAALFKQPEEFRLWFWQVLLNAATIEGYLEDAWWVGYEEEQLVARPVDDLPKYISIFTEKIRSVNELQDFLSICEAMLNNDEKFCRQSDSVWQHLNPLMMEVLNRLTSNRDRLSDEDYNALQKIVDLGFDVNLLTKFRLSDFDEVQAETQTNYVTVVGVDGYEIEINPDKLEDLARLSDIIHPYTRFKSSARLLTNPNGITVLIKAVLTNNYSEASQNSRIFKTKDGRYYYKLEINGSVFNVLVWKVNGSLYIDHTFKPEQNEKSDNELKSAPVNISSAESHEHSIDRLGQILHDIVGRVSFEDKQSTLTSHGFDLLKQVIMMVRRHRESTNNAAKYLGELIKNNALPWLVTDITTDRNINPEKIARDLMYYISAGSWGVDSYDHFTDEALAHVTRLEKEGYTAKIPSAYKRHRGIDRAQFIKLHKGGDKNKIIIALCVEKNNH